jgi:hypothetical protein
VLFFKPKKETPEQTGAAVLSRAPRYDCLVFVEINGYEGQAVLRNISETGFRMESKIFADIEIGSNYVMRINPDESSGMKPFDVTVEVRWALSSPDNFALGLLVTQGDNRFFQKYVDYLKSHHKKAG